MQLTIHSCQILIKIEFCRQIFEKKTQMLIFVRISQIGAKLFHADKRNDEWKYRQTDMTRYIVAFLSFAKATKNEI